MRSLLAVTLLVGLSTVGWSDTIHTNVDQSNSTPIEVAAFANLNLSSVIPVEIDLIYVDKDKNPFLARLALKQGGSQFFTPGALGTCDILVSPGSTSGSCMATAGFVPSNPTIAFGLYEPDSPNTPDTSSADYWVVTSVSVTQTTSTSTPEPSTASLLLVALGASSWAARHYRLSGSGKARL
jgi:hypothetical protein